MRVPASPRSRPRDRSGATAPRDVFEQLLTDGAIHAVYQPIVELETGLTVAHEALARGPAGSPFESPEVLFREAHARNLVPQLDRLCQDAAIRGAFAAGSSSALPLFVNFEPAALGQRGSRMPVDGTSGSLASLQLVAEITERSLLDRPADLLREVERLRADGWAIALDDVGAVPDSAAVMPLLDPDVIKLDLAMIQGLQTPARVSQLAAVLAHAERSNALILAEGIETEAHRRLALSMGATFGQGWLFGRPGPFPEVVPPQAGPSFHPGVRQRSPVARTPVEAVFPRRNPRRATKEYLVGFSRHLENWALAANAPPIVLAAFQTLDRFTPRSRRMYAALAERCVLVAVAGAGISETPLPGVRGWSLADGNELLGQWHVIVLGPHIAGALIAKDLGDDGPDNERRFDYVVTFERELVLEAARSFLARVASI